MMDALRLMIPDESHLAEAEAYKQAMQAAGSSMDGTGSLSRMDAAAWLQNCRAIQKEETCPEGWVPATQYVCVRERDGRIVGMIDLRRRFNDFLREYGGSIGYSVRPDERRKGYAKWMLAQVLAEAARIGLPRVLVTCDADNEGSRRTIEANGGVFEREAFLAEEGLTLRRYWIDTSPK